MTDNIFILIFIMSVSFMGYKVSLLSSSGALAASFVGFGVFLGFGVKGLLILGFFFASSSLFSKFRKKAKDSLDQKHSKGSRRDWIQVFANGGLAAGIGLTGFYMGNHILLIAFLIAIASATSDTWASEIGTLSKKKPLFIRNLKRIEKGTSGAITLLGTISALGGALSISLLSLWWFNINLMETGIVLIFGFIGNIMDTLLGAFFQAAYKCERCCIETEKSIHCGKPAYLIRGFPFMTNDTVNFLSTFLAVGLGILFLSLK